MDRTYLDLVLRRLMVEYQNGSAPAAEHVVEVKGNMSKDGKSVKISSIKMPETK